jgi:hypothetical protein
MPDPKAILETSLRHYTCATLHDTIKVSGFGKVFDLNIVVIN